jgi:ribA/ribD-fused uncharacterized protein
MDVLEFRGEFWFLSNFCTSEITFHYLGREWTATSVEHAYQACKSLNPDDVQWVLLRHSPGEAKREGRRIKIRADWEQIKDEVMMTMLRKKFADPTFRDKLLAIDGRIVEGNYWHDNYWGVCTCRKCSAKSAGNKLGALLMTLRRELANAVHP